MTTIEICPRCKKPLDRLPMVIDETNFHCPTCGKMKYQWQNSNLMILDRLGITLKRIKPTTQG